VLTVVVKDSVTVAALLVWLFYLNWKLTLIALVAAPLIALALRQLSRRLRQMAREAQRSMGELVHVIEETIECHKVVKYSAGTSTKCAVSSTRTSACAGSTCARRSLLLRPRRSRRSSPRSRSRSSSISRSRIRIAGADAGEFASFMIAMLMLLAPLKAADRYQCAVAARPRRRRERVRHDRRAGRAGSRHGKVGRARGEVPLEGVSFTYPTRTEPALSGVDLLAARRDGRAGRGSGGGKTTLVNLLPRFYAPVARPHPARWPRHPRADAREPARNVALVSQDVVLFNDTIQANIAYGGMSRASEQEVAAAADAAHASEFIREIAAGPCDARRRERRAPCRADSASVSPSHGAAEERAVLILDEATSALDSESERLVQAALDALMRGRTTIGHCAPPVDDRARGPDRGARTGTRRRDRHACAALARDGVYAKLYRIQLRPAVARRGGRSTLGVKPLAIVHTESSLGWGGQEIRSSPNRRDWRGAATQLPSVCASGPHPAEAPLGACLQSRCRSRPSGRRPARADRLARSEPVRCASTRTARRTPGSRPSRQESAAQSTPSCAPRHISAPVPRNPASRWLYERGAAKIVTTGEALKQELVHRNGFRADASSPCRPASTPGAFVRAIVRRNAQLSGCRAKRRCLGS
jgi:subfamily B ATP-binding cassette protein MsbA